MLMHSFGFQTLPVRVFEYFPRLGEPGERITAQLEKCPELMNLNLKLAIGMKLLDTVQWLSARGYIQLSAILPKMEEIGWFDNKAPLYVVSVTFEGNMEIPIRNWCFGDFVYTTSINPSIPTNTNNVDACIVTNQSSVNISTGVTTDSISMMNSNEKFFDVANNFTNDNLTMSTNNDTVNIAHENLIINTTSYDYKVDHQPRNDLYQTYQPLFGYNNYSQILPMTYDLHSANPPQPRLRMGTYMNHLRSSLESTNYYPSQSEKEMLASQSLYDPFLSPAFSNSGFDPTLFTTINNSNIHANNIGTTIGGLNLVNNDSMLLYYKDRLFDNNVFDLVQSEQKMHAKYAEPTLMNGVNEMRTTPQEKTINKFSNVKEIKRRKSKSKEINNSRSPEDGVNQISGMNMTLAKTHYKSNQAKRSPGLVETNSCENQLSTTSEPNSTPSTLSPPSESNKPREKKLVPMGNGSKLKPKLNVKEDSSEPPNKRKKGEQKLELKLNKKIFSKKMNDLTSPNDDKKITFNTASFHGVLNRAELIFESDVKQFVESWTKNETDFGRRLIKFNRRHSENTLYCSFEVISQEEYMIESKQYKDKEQDTLFLPFEHSVISIISSDDKESHFVTSVDLVNLLEFLLQVIFTLEEKNRIRRNLELFTPITISRNTKDYQTLFRKIMAFPNPKPRNIEKGIKIFPINSITDALKKVVGKHTASRSSTLMVNLRPLGE